MLFVDDPTWKPELPPVLTDEQWKCVAYRSKLPLEARYNIDNIIGLYRQQLADAETKYPDIWKKLEVAKQTAAEALDRLEAVLSDPNAFAAIAMGIDGQRQVPPQKLAAFRSWLEQQRKELQALVSGYDNAMERVHNRKRGPRTGRDSLLTLVGVIEPASRGIYRSEDRGQETEPTPLSNSCGTCARSLIQICFIVKSCGCFSPNFGSAALLLLLSLVGMWATRLRCPSCPQRCDALTPLMARQCLAHSLSVLG